MVSEYDEGSTIIEAMIAVAILGCAMAVVMPSYISAMSAAQVQKQYARALILLENEFASRIYQGFVEAGLNERRQQTVDDITYEVRSGAEQVPGRGIDLLTVNVKWPAAGRQARNIEVATYLFDVKEKKGDRDALQ